MVAIADKVASKLEEKKGAITEDEVINYLNLCHLLFSLLSVTQFLWFEFWEFSIGPTDNPLIDIFLYSHHLSPWYCVDIITRNSFVVMHGS